LVYCNRSGHAPSSPSLFHVKPKRPLPAYGSRMYVADMVTNIRRGARPHLYLREHRKARGLSAEYMAGRLDMERESLLRLEREARTRCTPDKQAQYADALGIEPAALWRPPGGISVDSMLAEAPADFRDMIVETVKRRLG
jgi:DNA-binding XRE family transcriptional regulator